MSSDPKATMADNEPDEKDRELEELDGADDGLEEVDSGVNSAISDSPAFWNSLSSSIEKAEKVNVASASYAKELSSFYSSCTFSFAMHC
jgi:hypothetical protein